jgi:hypothetical protein
MFVALCMSLSLVFPAALVLVSFGFPGVFQGGTPADLQVLFSLCLVSLFSGIGLLLLTFEAIYLRTMLKECFLNTIAPAAETKDDRAHAKVGDKVKLRWYDDPQWYEGTVKDDAEGLYVVLEDNSVGYLEDADEVHILK